jgi:acyl dehydratase
MGTTWDDLSIGTEAPLREIGPLTRTDFVRYQGASGDFNPIHHDEEFAQAAGYPSVFSVGMLQAGILATYATDWLGAANVRRFGVQFREQVWPGDRLVCSGKVVERHDDGAERTVDLELEVHRINGGAAIKGWATFAVPE